MKFIENIEKEKYNDFVKNHIKSHFLQSYEWGEFAKKEKGLTPHYVGLIENDELVCATLLLQKHLPGNFSYFYSPRGFVIDFNNEKLVKEFVKNIVEYIKKYNAIFLKIDPDLVINKANYLDESIDSEYNQDKIINLLSSLGFKHKGFTQQFETMQPRFSFRIDFNQDFDNVFEHFSKTTKQRIKKAEEFDVDVKVGTYDDIKDFYHLMRITEDRKDFVTHNLSYYQTLYNLFNKDDGVNLFIGSVNVKKILDDKLNKEKELKKEIEELENITERSKKENTKYLECIKSYDKIKLDIEKYNDILTLYGENIILNGHYIIKYGDKAWVLYAGNHNILTDTYANYKTYLEHIKYYYDKVKIYDQFGTVGKIDKTNSLYGLHEFKKKFGGDYVEFIGEFDLVLNKPMYFAFTKLVPFYRNIIKKIAKKDVKKEIEK